MRIPINPPKTMFPAYQPLRLAEIYDVAGANPGLVYSTLYRAVLKKPAPDFNVTVVGVSATCIACPFLSFVIVTLAPGGVEVTVTGQFDLLTILAQLQIDSAATDVINGVSFIRAGGAG